MKRKKAIAIAVAIGISVSSFSLMAAEKSDSKAYIAIPKRMFDKLTGAKKEKKEPVIYLYENGKIEKTSVNPESLKPDEPTMEVAKIRNDVRNKMDKVDNMGRKGERGDRERGHKKGKGPGDIVLLTADQLKTLMKSKAEAKLNEIDSPDSKLAKAYDGALDKAKVIEVNGQQAKVVFPREIMQDFDGGCRK